MVLSEFLAEFCQYISTTHTAKSTDNVKQAFKQLIRIIGDVPLAGISVRDIERFLATKEAEASRWTARKYYIALAAAFERGKVWGYIPANPFREVMRPRCPETYPAYFSVSDFQSLLLVISDNEFREFCLVAVLTGMRLGELLELKWSDINIPQKTILVQNSRSFTTKSKRNRVIPMSEQLYLILARRKSSATADYVFHRKCKKLNPHTVSKNFKRFVREAGLDDRLHFHSLRHSFASWLVQKDVSLYKVQKLLGHASISTTETYAHLNPEDLHDEVNKLSIGASI